MPTAIGRQFLNAPWRLLLACLFGAAVVTGDFVLNWQHRVASDQNTASIQAYEEKSIDYRADRITYEALMQTHDRHKISYRIAVALRDRVDYFRWPLTLVVFAVYLLLAKGDRASVGLTLRPNPSWKYWTTTGVVVGLLIAACLLPPAVLWALQGWRLEDIIEGSMVESFLTCPILEEVVYRAALCTPLAALWGVRPTIVVSGIAFALLHVVYGTANPVNLLAGFFLAWTFLKSNSILIPMLFHAGGNVIFYYLALFLFAR